MSSCFRVIVRQNKTCEDFNKLWQVFSCFLLMVKITVACGGDVCYLFELLLAEFILPLLWLQKAAELLLLLHLNVLLELLLIVGKRLQLHQNANVEYFSRDIKYPHCVLSFELTFWSCTFVRLFVYVHLCPEPPGVFSAASPSPGWSCSFDSPALCPASACAHPSRPSACSPGPSGASDVAVSCVCTLTSAPAAQSPAHVPASHGSPARCGHRVRICTVHLDSDDFTSMIKHRILTWCF